ncbi:MULTISPECIES: UTP--glucose-1-phosphate uridylyltransferase GalU [unclassified Streptomyces]|uniref:UTP--glucose-1-phosphate uridylyltransferase GalU n=1 Tax=unclassified Streptomyces TaxID=2593676 RepID=UPI00224FFFDC|nr:UTP--glucose-1-phosphate uridylyltransferase GalU [Streptomyces sp. NBC_00047]MCX5609299.1 UTP--glucose-1-phosphate uridylyltransferase GalU [Streptomyces sp. NBC_00047]
MNSTPHRITKAVIPAAGLGTRFLPLTKATPKEMLPVVDKPAIQYVVEEAVAAGMSDILMVTGRNKRPLEDHFDRNYELEEALQRRGDQDKLDSVCASTELADIHYVRQRDPKGLGHAVLCAAPHVGQEPFAVLLADDLIDPRDPLLARMAEVRAQHGGSVVALMEVDPDAIHQYGCAAVEERAGGAGVRITELVEKPEPGTAPSNLAIIGRYLLDPEIFEVLRGTSPGRGGEIQLTDALRALVQAGRPVHGVVFSGRRYDTGDRAEYLRATVRLACERADLGPEFLAWLKEFVRSEQLVGV